MKKIMLVVVFVAVLGWLGFNQWLTPPEARTFSQPIPTTWRPVGPRVPGYNDYSVIPHPNGWHTMHADIQESDEVWIAAAPTFELDWVAEESMFIPEGPTFDNQGRIYFSPLSPREDVSLVVLDSKDGKRLWTLPGGGAGAGAPLILNDPNNAGEQIIYHATYEQFWAVRGDGTIIWQHATGLKEPKVEPGEFHATHQWGVSYIPQTDAVIGVTMDAKVFAHDRTTGKPLSAPYQLPGKPTNPADTGLPQIATNWGIEQSNKAFGERIDGISHFEGVLNIIYGGRAQISNAYAVDPHSGRIYIAATAPDASDGKADGISDNGAIYAVELHRDGDNHFFSTNSRYDFVGGSGSTPALTQDGKRLMVSDELGNVIAINARTMQEDWRYNVGDQIAASIAVSSDNGERYVVTKSDVFKLIDHGDRGELAWTAKLDAYPGAVNFNALTPTITANGILMSQGAGVSIGSGQLMAKVGVGLLDRATGELRWYAEGREDSISVMTIGPDAAPYTAGSPIRRMAAKGLYGDRLPKIIGGITRYKPTDPELLANEAICAAHWRAENAANYGASHPAALATDRKQIRTLVDQALRGAEGNRKITLAALKNRFGASSTADISTTLGALCES